MAPSRKTWVDSWESRVVNDHARNREDDHAVKSPGSQAGPDGFLSNSNYWEAVGNCHEALSVRDSEGGPSQLTNVPAENQSGMQQYTITQDDITQVEEDVHVITPLDLTPYSSIQPEPVFGNIDNPVAPQPSRNQLSESRWASKSKTGQVATKGSYSALYTSSKQPTIQLQDVKQIRAKLQSSANNLQQGMSTTQPDNPDQTMPVIKQPFQSSGSQANKAQLLPPHLRQVHSPVTQFAASRATIAHNNILAFSNDQSSNHSLHNLTNSPCGTSQKLDVRNEYIQQHMHVRLEQSSRTSSPPAHYNDVNAISTHEDRSSAIPVVLPQNSSQIFDNSNPAPYIPPHLRNSHAQHNAKGAVNGQAGMHCALSTASGPMPVKNGINYEPDQRLPPHLRNFYAKRCPNYIKLRPNPAQSEKSSGDKGSPTIQYQPVKQDRFSTEDPMKLTTEALNVISSQREEAMLSKNFNTGGDSACRNTPELSAENSLTFESVSDNQDVLIKDVRGEELRETWEHQDWNAVRRDRPKRRLWESETQASEDSNSSSRSAYAPPVTFLHRFVLSWMERVPRVQGPLFIPVADNQADGDAAGNLFEKHGIDPVTGRFMEPIKAPIEKKNHALNEPGLKDKHEQQTAQWSADQWLGVIGRQKFQIEEREKQVEYDRQIVEMAEERATRGNPFLCRVPAHVRPATEIDMEDVTRIYNQEVRNGYRALDEEPQSAQDFCKLLRTCRAENTPFLVAISEYRNPNVPINHAGHRAIGFAFLVIASRGIFGSTKSNGKHSGRLYIMVDPPFRRERVGTALVDRMLIITTRGYMQKENAYQWVNPTNDPIYNAELYNLRKWRTLQMEVFIQNLVTVAATKAGVEYKQIVDWFERDLDIDMVLHTSNYCVADNKRNMFLDRLLFEHRCHEFEGDIGA